MGHFKRCFMSGLDIHTTAATAKSKPTMHCTIYKLDTLECSQWALTISAGRNYWPDQHHKQSVMQLAMMTVCTWQSNDSCTEAYLQTTIIGPRGCRHTDGRRIRPAVGAAPTPVHQSRSWTCISTEHSPVRNDGRQSAKRVTCLAGLSLPSATALQATRLQRLNPIFKNSCKPAWYHSMVG